MDSYIFTVFLLLISVSYGMDKEREWYDIRATSIKNIVPINIESKQLSTFVVIFNNQNGMVVEKNLSTGSKLVVWCSRRQCQFLLHPDWYDYIEFEYNVRI